MAKKSGRATGRKVETITEAGRQTVKAAKPTPPQRKRGAGGIIAGTKKERAFKLFTSKGRDEVIQQADKLGIQPGTARTWCSIWHRASK